MESNRLMLDNDLLSDDKTYMKINLYRLLFKIGIMIGFFPFILLLPVVLISFLFVDVNIFINGLIDTLKFWPSILIGVLIMIFSNIKLKNLEKKNQ